MELIEKLQQIVATAQEEATKFYEKGNKSAGTRLRKTMQELKSVAQEIRFDVSSKK